MFRTAMLLPISLDQLITWARLGIQALPWNQGVWVIIGGDSKPQLTDRVRQSLAMAVPVHEDDLSVLIAQIQDPDLFEAFAGQSSANNLFVPISSVVELHPISERGALLLEGKLDEVLTNLIGPPLEIDELRQRAALWFAYSRKTAGYDFLDSFGFEGSQWLGEAVEETVLEELSGQSNSQSLVAAVLRYGRASVFPGRPVIPNNDSGFLSDLGRIIISVHSGLSREQKEQLRDLRDAIQLMRSTLSRQLLREPHLVFPRAVAQCLPQLGAVRDMTDPFDPVSIIIFLKARDLLSGEGRRTVSGDRELAQVLAAMANRFDPELREAFASGIQLCGMLEGYNNISSVAYWLRRESVEFGKAFIPLNHVVDPTRDIENGVLDKETDSNQTTVDPKERSLSLDIREDGDIEVPKERNGDREEKQLKGKVRAEDMIPEASSPSNFEENRGGEEDGKTGEAPGTKKRKGSKRENPRTSKKLKAEADLPLKERTLFDGEIIDTKKKPNKRNSTLREDNGDDRD